MNFEKQMENQENPRHRLMRLIKEELIASRSTAHNASEREKAASDAIDQLLINHPELEEEVDEIQERMMEKL